MSYNIDTIHDFGNLPFVTDDTLVEQRGRFVTVGAGGVLAIATAAGAADGVLRNNPVTGEAPAVTMGGFPYVVDEAGTLAVGDEVEVGAAGGAVVADAGTVVGKVLEIGVDNWVRIKLA